MRYAKTLGKEADGADIFGSNDSEDSKDDYDNVSEESKDDE